MNTKHTQGPWRVGEMRGEYIDINHCNKDQKGAISLTLAKVTARQSWLAESEANARLIAAAPELLEALEGAVEWAKLNKQRAGTLDVIGMSAAIAKAKGEA